jgi:hypothetical protein
MHEEPESRIFGNGAHSLAEAVLGPEHDTGSIRENVDVS